MKLYTLLALSLLLSSKIINTMDSSDARQLIDQANQLIKSNHIEQAKANLEKATECKDECTKAVANFNLGNLYWKKKKDNKNALSCYKEAYKQKANLQARAAAANNIGFLMEPTTREAYEEASQYLYEAYNAKDIEPKSAAAASVNLGLLLKNGVPETVDPDLETALKVLELARDQDDCPASKESAELAIIEIFEMKK